MPPSPLPPIKIQPSGPPSNPDAPQLVTVDGSEKLTPCSPGDPCAIEMTWTEIDSDQLLEPPLVLKDFVKAVKGARPTVSQEDIKKSSEWTTEFGSEGA